MKKKNKKITKKIIKKKSLTLCQTTKKRKKIEKTKKSAFGYTGLLSYLRAVVLGNATCCGQRMSSLHGTSASQQLENISSPFL